MTTPLSPLAGEEIISLGEAAKMFGNRRAGKPTHVNSVYRWVSEGYNGLVLESVKMCGNRMTSREAVHRFINAMNPDDHNKPADTSRPGRSSRPADRSSKAQQARSAAARDELRRTSKIVA